MTAGDLETRHGFAGARRTLGGLGGHFGAPHLYSRGRSQSSHEAAPYTASCWASWTRASAAPSATVTRMVTRAPRPQPASAASEPSRCSIVMARAAIILAPSPLHSY